MNDASLAAVVASSALGCGAVAPSEDEPTQAAESDLHSVPSVYWPRGSAIPVCWTFDGFDQDKQGVKDVVQSQWGAVSTVSFNGDHVWDLGVTGSANDSDRNWYIRYNER